MDRSRTAFAQLDRIPPELRALLIAALDAMAADPEIQRVRQVASEALAPRPGERILDAGCGLGEVARYLAAAVAPDGEIVALDLSAATVQVAGQRHDGSPVRYVVGDVAALEFPAASFDAVRSERVLQHLAEPDAAIAELVRVTRLGGRVCLVDTDWESLTVDGLPDELVATMREAVVAGTRRRGHLPEMGRTLRRRMTGAGLTDVMARPVTLCFPDQAAAAAVIPLFNPQIPREAELVPEDLREDWFAAVAAASARGELLVALTMWVVVGVR
jgi:SAM-dependent methyltransferase